MNTMLQKQLCHKISLQPQHVLRCLLCKQILGNAFITLFNTNCHRHMGWGEGGAAAPPPQFSRKY